MYEITCQSRDVLNGEDWSELDWFEEWNMSTKERSDYGKSEKGDDGYEED